MIIDVVTIGLPNLLKAVKYGKTVVEFSAKWCVPCRSMKPIMEELCKTCRVIMIDVDDNMDIMHHFNISSVPTILIFVEGEVKQFLVGSKTEAQVLEALNSA